VKSRRAPSDRLMPAGRGGPRAARRQHCAVEPAVDVGNSALRYRVAHKPAVGAPPPLSARSGARRQRCPGPHTAADRGRHGSDGCTGRGGAMACAFSITGRGGSDLRKYVKLLAKPL